MTLYNDIGATFDEVRYGTTLGDVVPLEPVGAPLITGDINCDGTYGQGSFGDINPFVQYLSNFTAWQATYPGCQPRVGDLNCDGTYGPGSFGDINRSFSTCRISRPGRRRTPAACTRAALSTLMAVTNRFRAATSAPS